jgi:hypothetical protein
VAPPVVLDEIASGDQQAQSQRIQLIANMPDLAVDERITALAEAIGNHSILQQLIQSV